MKKYFIICSLIFIIVANNANSHEKLNQLKKRTKPTTQTNKHNDYFINHIDLNMLKLPINFKGINPIDIFNLLEKRENELIKKEFETTNEFQNRSNQVREKTIIKNLTIDSLFYFKVLLLKPKWENSDIINYDADRQELSVKNDLEWTSVPSEGNKSKPSVYLKKRSKSRKYLGSNAFGANVLITEYHDYSYNLVIQNFSDLQNSDEKEFIESKFYLDSNSAKQIKKNKSLGCIYIGKLSHPYINIGYDNVSATFDFPTELVYDYKYIYMIIYEIWFYNTFTGEIIHKQKVK